MQGHVRVRDRRVADHVQLRFGEARQHGVDENVIGKPAALAPVPQANEDDRRRRRLWPPLELVEIDAVTDHFVAAIEPFGVATDSDRPRGQPDRQLLQRIDDILDQFALEPRRALRLAQRRAVHGAHGRHAAPEPEPVVAMHMDDVVFPEIHEIQQQRQQEQPRPAIAQRERIDPAIAVTRAWRFAVAGQHRHIHGGMVDETAGQPMHSCLHPTDFPLSGWQGSVEDCDTQRVQSSVRKGIDNLALNMRRSRILYLVRAEDCAIMSRYAVHRPF